LPNPARPDTAGLFGAALSCLFVGLQRWHRGVRLSAARMVQTHAIDRPIELLCGDPAGGDADPANQDRPGAPHRFPPGGGPVARG
jgi:hypothetical protein